MDIKLKAIDVLFLEVEIDAVVTQGYGGPRVGPELEEFEIEWKALGQVYQDFVRHQLKIADPKNPIVTTSSGTTTVAYSRGGLGGSTSAGSHGVNTSGYSSGWSGGSSGGPGRYVFTCRADVVCIGSG